MSTNVSVRDLDFVDQNGLTLLLKRNRPRWNVDAFQGEHHKNGKHGHTGKECTNNERVSEFEPLKEPHVTPRRVKRQSKGKVFKGKEKRKRKIPQNFTKSQNVQKNSGQINHGNNGQINLGMLGQTFRIRKMIGAQKIQILQHRRRVKNFHMFPPLRISNLVFAHLSLFKDLNLSCFRRHRQRFSFPRTKQKTGDTNTLSGKIDNDDTHNKGTIIVQE